MLSCLNPQLYLRHYPTSKEFPRGKESTNLRAFLLEVPFPELLPLFVIEITCPVGRRRGACLWEDERCNLCASSVSQCLLANGVIKYLPAVRFNQASTYIRLVNCAMLHFHPRLRWVFSGSQEGLWISVGRTVSVSPSSPVPCTHTRGEGASATAGDEFSGCLTLKLPHRDRGVCARVFCFRCGCVVSQYERCSRLLLLPADEERGERWKSSF